MGIALSAKDVCQLRFRIGTTSAITLAREVDFPLENAGALLRVNAMVTRRLFSAA
jgi:hypothetical protein